jgi:hypothetical protein
MYKTLIAYGNTSRREDLEDMLADPAYFQAIFHTLSKVKELYKGQAELGRANGTIASAFSSSTFGSYPSHLIRRHQTRISLFKTNYTNYVQRPRMPLTKPKR